MLAPISQLYPLSIMPENAKNKKSTTKRVFHSLNFEEKREKKERILKAKSLKFHLKNQMKSYSKTKICDIVNF